MATKAEAQAMTVTTTAAIVRPSGGAAGSARTGLWMLTEGQ
jgi:hypothetical protein